VKPPSPLQPKVWLRSGGPLTSTVRLSRRTKMRAMSPKRAKIAGERRRFVAQVLEARPTCELSPLINEAHDRGKVNASVGSPLSLVQVRCQRRSHDVHEILTRGRGGKIVPSQGLAERGVLALCRSCHDYVTEHPPEAEAIGAVAHSWSAREASDDVAADS
jgi:hypothetical protein